MRLKIHNNGHPSVAASPLRRRRRQLLRLQRQLGRADGPATARARAEALAALEDDDFFDYASLGHQIKGLVGNGGAFFDSHIISFIEPQAGRLIRVFVRRRDGKLGIGLNDANEVLDLPPAELCDGELKVFDRVLSIDEVVIGPRKLVDVLRDLPVQEKHELRCVRWGDAPAPPVRDPETGAMLNAVAVRNLVDNQAAIAPEVDAAEWRAHVVLAVREARNSEVAARRYLRADHRHRTNQAEVGRRRRRRARRRGRARRSKPRKRASVSKRLARGAARRVALPGHGSGRDSRRAPETEAEREARLEAMEEEAIRELSAPRAGRPRRSSLDGGGGGRRRRNDAPLARATEEGPALRRASTGELDPEAATAALALLADPEERLSTNFADEVRAGEGVPMHVMAGCGGRGAPPRPPAPAARPAW